MRKLLIALLLLPASVLPPPIQAQSDASLRVIVRFQSHPALADLSAISAAGGRVTGRFDIVPAVAATIPARAVAALASHPRVARVEEDAVHGADDYVTELDWTWGVKHIGAGDVHGGVQGHTGRGVRVAVFDSGINYTHPDLAPNYRGGYDFVNNDAAPWDDNGHGTHVAGTIAAARDDAGVVGVAPDVDLYAVKVLGADGYGYVSTFISGIDWAVRNSIQVTNHSYGGVARSAIFEEALANAAARGMVHTASAGNRGACDGTGDSVGYPAGYRSVIAVAATDSTDTRACFSSTGPDVEIAAPGVQIRSTLRSGAYGDRWNGTSMAAPHVAGTAALLLGSGLADANGNGFLHDDVRNLMARTVVDLGAAGRDALHGFGRIDARAAAEAITTPAALTCSVDSIAFAAGSGKESKDVSIAIGVVYGLAAILPGAAITGHIEKDGLVLQQVNGITNNDGRLPLVVKNAPRGVYRIIITSVTSAGMDWDGRTPPNSYRK